ncbi:MAG: TonB-dependent receptor [Bacteroidales bacterium]
MKRQISTMLLILFLEIILSTALCAQRITVSGKVTDAADGSSLVGATVQEKGTNNGVFTDTNGTFSITVAPTATLVFTYVGYTEQEIPVNGRTAINIAMSVTATNLGEVVVIGYGTVKKSDATGSIITVSAKDFNKGVTSSPQDLLVGKTPGLVITTNGGAPGSGATIRIRGGSSLNASNDPLVVVDGVPLDNNDVAGSDNFLSFINPNDIETVTVLKDASATAIYGSRASNGVIIITTKRGQAGEKMRVTYVGNVSVSNAIKFVDVFSGDQVRQIALNHQSLYGVESFLKLGSQNTDWQKEIFRVAVSTDHDLSLSGSYKFLPYRVSVGYTDDNGILKNTGMKRYTGAISLNPTFFKNNLKVTLNANGMRLNNNFSDVGAIGSAIAMDPTQVIRDGNPNSDGYFQWNNYGATLGTPNPVEQLLATDNRSKVERFIGNIEINANLPYIKGLVANLNIATSYNHGQGHDNLPTSAPAVLTNGYGQLDNYDGTNYNNLLDFYLNYKRDFNALKSNLDVTGGYSWQHFKREGHDYKRGIVDATHKYQMVDSTEFITENYLVSFFGRLNYTVMNRYLLTVTVRDDGSSRFIGKNRWGIFPSVALAWKIKDESFLKNVKALSDLKLRLSWGVTGQQDIGSDYPAEAQYIASVIGAYYPMGTNASYIPTLRPNAYDPNIKWEQTKTQNAGVDFGFFDGRISGSLDVYKRVTDNLLENATIPSGSNFSNTLWTNVGSLENMGAEFDLNLIPISTKDQSLTIGFNLSYNQNKITKLLLTNDPTYIGQLEGGDSFTGPLQVSQVGSPAHSFFMNRQVYDVNGNPVEGLYVDLSGQGGTVNGNNADKYIAHNPAHDRLMGLSVRYTYKQFDLSASGRLSLGNYVYNQVQSGASYDQMWQIGYWHNEPAALAVTDFVKRQFTSDYFVQNASFFKLDYLNAGYLFNNVVNKLNLRISLTVRNLFIITKYSGIDPEVNGGIDNNFYPRPRTYLFGLSLTY